MAKIGLQTIHHWGKHIVVGGVYGRIFWLPQGKQVLVDRSTICALQMATNDDCYAILRNIWRSTRDNPYMFMERRKVSTTNFVLSMCMTSVICVIVHGLLWMATNLYMFLLFVHPLIKRGNHDTTRLLEVTINTDNATNTENHQL
jgi:hypothetical protein